MGDLRVIDDEGVTFKSHLDGTIHRFTPEHSIEVQEALGPDIAVAFDQPVFPSSPRATSSRTPPTGRTAGRSARWPRTRGPTRPCSASSRAALTRSCARSPPGSSPVCRSTASTSAAWRATRRPSSGTRPSTPTIPFLDGDPRPRYLMGLGSPLDLLDAVHRGVDLFDSVLPARVARNAQLWIPGGPAEPPQRALPGRSAARPGGLSVPAVHALLEGLPGPPVPGQGAARVPARDLSQPDLHPRLHGQDPGCAARRNLPRRDWPSCAPAPSG